MARLVLLLLLISNIVSAQVVPGYTNINSGYKWPKGIFDSSFVIPRYNGVPSGLRGGAQLQYTYQGSGHIGIDTVNHKFYFYSGGDWHEAGEPLLFARSDNRNNSGSPLYFTSASQDFFIDSINEFKVFKPQDVNNISTEFTVGTSGLNIIRLSVSRNPGGNTFYLSDELLVGSVYSDDSERATLLEQYADTLKLSAYNYDLNKYSYIKVHPDSLLLYGRNSWMELSSLEGIEFYPDPADSLFRIETLKIAPADTTDMQVLLWKDDAILSDRGKVYRMNLQQLLGMASGGTRFGVSGEDATAAQHRTFTHSGFQLQLYAENGLKQQLIRSMPDSTLGMYLRNNSSNDLAYIYLSGSDSSANIKGGRQTHGSAIKVSDAGIVNTPFMGLVKYDSLNHSVLDTDKMMVWDSATGDVATRAVPTGGGGSGTVNTGSANTLAYYPGAGTTVDDLATIIANRALISDANGLPTHSVTTATELSYVNGVTSAIQDQLNSAKTDNFPLGVQAMGGGMKAEAFGTNLVTATGSTALTDGQARYQAVYLPTAQTLNGLKFFIRTQGNFTGDNNNRVALYSYSGGTLTQVATSANDEAIWKAASNTYTTASFTAPYAAAAGLYFVGFIYNNSAQVTAPALGHMPNMGNAAMGSPDLTNSTFISMFLSSQSNIATTTQATSGLTATATVYYFYLY